MSEDRQSCKAPLTFEESLGSFRLTRDFDLYLDMLNVLKNRYLIILCLKNTSDQSISEKTAERIHLLGFRNFTAEPEMRYVGILHNGSVFCDSACAAHEPPASYKGSVQSKEFFISFEGKEAEIKINGKDQSLNDKGINIAVYDLKDMEIADVSCYNAAENNPTFYHCNFHYDKQYIDTHIYIPESYKESVTLPLRRSYFSNRRLNVREVEGGIFLPTKDQHEFDENGKRKETYKACGGICDEGFNFIAGHQLFDPRGISLDDRHISGSYEVSPENIDYVDETVLYGGSLIEHPGHLITESFADRLWWTVQNADSDIKIAVEIIWRTSELAKLYSSFVMELLDLLGIPEERLIIIKKPTKFRKIIVPDQSAVPLNYTFPYEFTDEYITVFQHIKKRLAPGKDKRIYLTKSSTRFKNIIGEEFFIDYFEKKGFRIVNPEEHTIREKAEMMYGADEVVTVDGTNSIFAVFCKPSVRLTILTRKPDFWNTPHQLINEALGIKEFFLVNTSGNFLENFSDDPFSNFSRGLAFVYVSKEFKKYVKHIYNEELDTTPEESLKKHLYEYLANFPTYYSQPAAFRCVKNIKMTDIMRSMSETFLGRELDTSGFDPATDDDLRIRNLVQQLMTEREASAEKIKLLTEKAKEFIDENARLKASAAQLEAENEQLRREKAELTSYMAEISSLLDALEAQGGLPTEKE